jgi:hypothetical protein
MKHCAVKTSIDGPSANAPVDNPLSSQCVCYTEWLLSAEHFKESIFSWSHFHVWRPRNATFQQEHIVGTTAFGGGGFTVWGCFSLNCKIDLYVIDGTLRA